ncbi:MAG: hypothetical protein RBT36_09680 [Desulfobulbus sp.]|jgi:hypothetical protein|nr:hypothetical protein [Desulfobulbus sp.]
MTLHAFLRAFCLFIALMLLPHAGTSEPANAQPLRDIVITMPAETVLASLQKILPLTIPSQHPGLQGDIVLESLDRLSIANNVLSLHGVLSGKNLIMLTNIAGQNIQLKLGQVSLPINCDLQTRFDQARGQLFVRPRFVNSGQAQNPNDLAGSLDPLLGALGSREYPVDLEALQLLNIRIGERTIPIAMQPVNITGTDNSLIFRLLPRVGSPR